MRAQSTHQLIKSIIKSNSSFAISPQAWGLLVGSLVLFLITIGAANITFNWISPIQLNNEPTRWIPEVFQVNDLWKDFIIPVSLLLIIPIFIHLLPRNKYSIAFANGTLIFVATRYIIWRALTINTSHPLSFLMSALLYAYELMYVIILYMEFIPSTTFDPRRRSREADNLINNQSLHQSSVDVFITTYNESYRQVRRCILACKALKYQNKKIYVLDDGNRQQIKKLASDLRVHYITRQNNQGRKAGNLNNALQQTSGDFILAVDCDFVVYPVLIQRVLSFFIDSKVAIVQTPQDYFIPDFHARNLGIEGLIPSDVDMFYNYQQVIRDNYNSVVCVGTSYIVRRSALEDIGGYVSTCIIEDHQTGTKLLTHGWKIIYLNEVLSVGETPKTFHDYLDQRLRWLQGNLQILLPGSGLKVFRSQTTNWQRVFYILHYISNFLPVGRTFFIFIPLVSLYFGNQLIIASLDAYAAYAIPFVVFLHVIPCWSSGGHTHQIWNEVYETITCVPWTKRVAQILFNPFQVHGGTVTPKDKLVSASSLDLSLARHLIAYIILFLFIYIFRHGLPLIDPSFQYYQVNSEGQEIMIAWSIYNFAIVAVALLCCIDKPSRRISERFPADLIVKLCYKSVNLNFWGATLDLSETGAAIVITSKNINLSQIQPGSYIELLFVDSDLLIKATVARLSHNGGIALPQIHLSFKPLSVREESKLVELIYSHDNYYMRPPRLTFSRSLFLFLRSLFSGESLLRRFDH